MRGMKGERDSRLGQIKGRVFGISRNKNDQFHMRAREDIKWLLEELERLEAKIHELELRLSSFATVTPNL
jgi:hypothetical protein